MQQQQMNIRDSKFFLITFYDGRQWQEDEVAERTPIDRVRKLLGGRWETSKEYADLNMKVFYNGQKRVMVMGFKPEATKADVEDALRQIREGREDRN